MNVPAVPPPAKPKSSDTARVWLDWARGNDHQGGCQCHGCALARRFLGAVASAQTGARVATAHAGR
jgi:hypothetical protein